MWLQQCLICIKRQTQRCNKILKVKVTMTRSKVKSRSHHHAVHLQPLTNVPTKHQLPTPYGFRDIARTRFYRSRSLRQGQIKVRPWRCTPTTPNQCPYQVSTSYTLRFLRYSLDKIFKLKITTARSKVKSRSHHDIAHLHIVTNVPTKYQLPTPYGFWDTAQTNFFPPPTRPSRHHGWKQYPDSPEGLWGKK